MMFESFENAILATGADGSARKRWRVREPRFFSEARERRFFSEARERRFFSEAREPRFFGETRFLEAEARRGGMIA